MDDYYRKALNIIYGQQDGGKFDWDAMQWRPPENSPK